MGTVLVQVCDRKQPPQRDQWHPWTNATPDAELAGMAAMKHVRERGGLLHDEDAIVLDVYLADAATPRWASGQPKECGLYIIAVGRDVL
jgi:hypothetical protein